MKSINDITLNFLTDESFVLLWYVSGLLLAMWVIYDLYNLNTSVNKSLKVGWPIIVIFFSVIGFLWYLLTCRPDGLLFRYPKENKKAFDKEHHHEQVSSTFSKVTGSVIHCVAGEGLGIMTAMVIARYIGLNFWAEFTGEYITGFLFGWILFQYTAMRSIGNSPSQALWKGGRAEFFSMITLMSGMLLTAKLIQPLIISSPPLPSTYTFWGLASLALFIGTIITYPMNWWLVSIGWKHGMN
ncbi:MAG: DUF4396 domain-containing protein [Bacteroidia bacterium]